MRKLFLALLFLSLNIVAQDFEFDTMTLYATKFKQYDTNILTYTNSKIDTYSLRIYKNENSYEAKLYDYKKNKIHYFKVNELKLNDGILNNFIYVTSEKFRNAGEAVFSKCVYDFETIENNGDIKKVKLNVYKNYKRKKSILHYELLLKANDFNLFHAFRVSCIHPFEFIQKFNYNQNCSVETAKGITLSGDIIQHRLVEYKKVNFILRIPK